MTKTIDWDDVSFKTQSKINRLERALADCMNEKEAKRLNKKLNKIWKRLK